MDDFVFFFIIHYYIFQISLKKVYTLKIKKCSIKHKEMTLIGPRWTVSTVVDFSASVSTQLIGLNQP